MNLTELIKTVDSLYPNAESNNDKIKYMNMALNSLYPEFGKIKSDETLVTVQGDDEYAFPSNIETTSQILDISIGNRPVPLNRHDYLRYSLGYEDEYPKAGRIYYQIYDSSGNQALVFHPIPSRSGLPIRIKYHQRFAELNPNTMDQVPELREEYQMMLAFYAVHMIAAKSASPDAVQADVFMQKFDSVLLQMWHHKMDREANNPVLRKDNSTWRRYR